MKNTSKILIGGLAAALMGAMIPGKANAGWLDMVNQATQKYNQASSQVQAVKNANQQIQQIQMATANSSAHNSAGSANEKTFEKTKTTNAITGEWGHQVTCEGPNSATCGNGMDDMVNCMHQTQGYYYRLIAANLKDRLDNHHNLSSNDRSDLQSDITSVTAAIDTGKVVDPDPNEPQRWLTWLSKEDQKQINQTNSKYMKEVHDDCEARFGGMTRYSGSGGK